MEVSVNLGRGTLARTQDQRKPSSQRGYGAQWRKIRAEVLRSHGIPKHLWSQYHVDHRPPYNPEIEPDHRKYQLVPMRASEHSSKTAAYDGGFGHGKKLGPHVKTVKPVSRIVHTEPEERVS